MYDIIIIEREVIKMTKQTDITKCRIELLKQFDYYIRNIIKNDEITCNWLIERISDKYCETGLKEIAIDDELWHFCVDRFFECCKAAGVI